MTKSKQEIEDLKRLNQWLDSYRAPWLIGLMLFMIAGCALKIIYTDNLWLDMGSRIFIMKALTGIILGISVYLGITLMAIGAALCVGPFVSTKYEHFYVVAGWLAVICLYFGFVLVELPFDS